MIDPQPSRPRRNRASAAMRDLMREVQVLKSDLIYPIFVREGDGISEEISTMPGIHRHSLDHLVRHLDEVVPLGIRAVALFPVLGDEHKDRTASESEIGRAHV